MKYAAVNRGGTGWYFRQCQAAGRTQSRGEESSSYSWALVSIFNAPPDGGGGRASTEEVNE